MPPIKSPTKHSRSHVREYHSESPPTGSRDLPDLPNVFPAKQTIHRETSPEDCAPRPTPYTSKTTSSTSPTSSIPPNLSKGHTGACPSNETNSIRDSHVRSAQKSAKDRPRTESADPLENTSLSKTRCNLLCPSEPNRSSPGHPLQSPMPLPQEEALPANSVSGQPDVLYPTTATKDTVTPAAASNDVLNAGLKRIQRSACETSSEVFGDPHHPSCGDACEPAAESAAPSEVGEERIPQSLAPDEDDIEDTGPLAASHCSVSRSHSPSPGSDSVEIPEDVVEGVVGTPREENSVTREGEGTSPGDNSEDCVNEAVERRVRAATVIHHACVQWWVRRRREKAVWEENTVRSMSAIRIQAAWRGYVGRVLAMEARCERVLRERAEVRWRSKLLEDAVCRAAEANALRAMTCNINEWQEQGVDSLLDQWRRKSTGNVRLATKRFRSRTVTPDARRLSNPPSRRVHTAAGVAPPRVRPNTTKESFVRVRAPEAATHKHLPPATPSTHTRLPEKPIVLSRTQARTPKPTSSARPAIHSSTTSTGPSHPSCPSQTPTGPSHPTHVAAGRPPRHSFPSPSSPPVGATSAASAASAAPNQDTPSNKTPPPTPSRPATSSKSATESPSLASPPPLHTRLSSGDVPSSSPSPRVLLSDGPPSTDGLPPWRPPRKATDIRSRSASPAADDAATTAPAVFLARAGASTTSPEGPLATTVTPASVAVLPTAATLPDPAYLYVAKEVVPEEHLLPLTHTQQVTSTHLHSNTRAETKRTGSSSSSTRKNLLTSHSCLDAVKDICVHSVSHESEANPFSAQSYPSLTATAVSGPSAAARRLAKAMSSLDRVAAASHLQKRDLRARKGLPSESKKKSIIW
eukprot:Rmarinus@m.11276